MHLEGTKDIAAPRPRVWETVTDPRQVAACVPGSPQVEVVDERHLRVRAPVGSGFLRTTVLIDIVLGDLRPPEAGTATASGSAMGGSAKADATLELAELGPASTRVTWAADLTLSGMLAGFGGMVEGPARNGMDQVLDCLKAKLESAESAPAAS